MYVGPEYITYSAFDEVGRTSQEAYTDVVN